MKNALIKILLSFYLDSDRPIPSWLQRSINNNPELTEHQQQMLDLQQRLRVDANDWIDQVPEPSDTASPTFKDIEPATKRWNAKRWQYAAALVATLLLLTGIGSLLIFQNSTPAIVDSPPAKDLRVVLVAYRASRDVSEQLQQGTRTYFTQLDSTANRLAIRQQENLKRAKQQLQKKTHLLQQLSQTLTSRVDAIDAKIREPWIKWSKPTEK